MSAGLATRNKLRTVNHHRDDVTAIAIATAEDDDYAFRCGRASDKLKAIDITFPDRPFMPNFGLSGNLGTPAEVDRTQENRIEAGWKKVFRVGVAIALALGALLLLGGPSLKQPRPPITSAPRHTPAIDTRLCTNDWHERCLVCTHVDSSGRRVQSSHC